MKDKIKNYRASMAQHKEDSLQYCLDLMDLCHALIAEGRKEEGLTELKAFLVKGEGDIFQLLSVFNLYAHNLDQPHLPPDLQPLFNRIFSEGGFQGVNISKPVEAIQNMHHVHLQSNQAFSYLVLSIKDGGMEKPEMKKAIEEYMNTETLPFYRDLANRLMQSI